MKIFFYSFFVFLFFPICLLANFSIISTIATPPGECKGIVKGIANGSSAPYTIFINGSEVQTGVNGLFTLSGLCEGPLEILLKDDLGCTFTLNTEIVSTLSCASLNVTLAFSNLITCENSSTGSLNINVTGGNPPYLYRWSNSKTSKNIYDLAAGNYTVTVTDFAGCMTTSTFNIEERVVYLEVIPDNSSGATNGCNGFIDLDVTIYPQQTPFTALWSNGATSTDISNLCPGTYTVTVTSENGCTKSFTQVINNCSSNSSPMQITDFDLSKLKDCTQSGGGEITVKVKGGKSPYHFKWSALNGYTYQSNTSTAKGITSGGTYQVTITDGCFNSVVGSIYAPCACGGWGFRDVKIEQVSPCLSSSSELKLTGVCWSSNIPKPNPFDFKIIWPNLQESVLSVTNFGICAGNATSTYTISGPTKYKVTQEANYFVAIIDEYGCLENKCFSFGDLVQENGLIKKPLIEVEPSYYDNFTEVYTGCFKCKSCRFGCDKSPAACDEGFSQSDFEYIPQDNKNPCTNARIVCTEGQSVIDVPTWVEGTPFIHWNEQLPTTEDGYCRYKSGCYFTAGVLDGIDDNYGVYVETEILIENENCQTIPPSYVDCPSPIRIYHQDDPCYYDVICGTTGETLASFVFDEEAVVYCYKKPLPQSGDNSCAVYSLCLHSNTLMYVDSYLTLLGDCSLVPQNILDLYGEPDIFDYDGDGNYDELILQDCSDYGHKKNKPQIKEVHDRALLNAESNDIRLYPNPFTNDFTIKNGDVSLINVGIKIYDFLGRICYTQSIDEFSPNEIINVVPNQYLMSGTYLIALNVGQQKNYYYVMVKLEDK